MRRPRHVSHDTLVEEARFVLKTLLRHDLFGDRVRLTEAESIIGKSIGLAFADYCSFLSKYGYINIESMKNDPLKKVVDVTEIGNIVAKNGEDPEFAARIGRHFARELGTASTPRTPGKEPPPPPPATELPPARASRTVTPIDEVIDRRYRRGEVLGAGPVGEVARGDHIGLGRAVAIKEARSIFGFVSYLKRDEIVRRLRAAVQSYAKLSHPGIIQVLDQNHEREFPYVVTELAPGGNLRQRMETAEGQRLSVSVAVRILLQVAYALEHAHAQGVLHLGIKPENVLFDEQGNAKLSDFGFSTIMDRQQSASQIPVLVGSGTVPYMAPERLQPDSDGQPLSPSTDIYALGILTYQMLTGKLPGRRSPMPSKACKNLPAAFDDVFDKMTTDEVSDRYASMSEVLTALYAAFAAKEVFAAGTILIWASDPCPPPLPEVAEDAVESVTAEAIESEEDASTLDAFSEDETHDGSGAPPPPQA